MNDAILGYAIRTLRGRLGWTQVDLGRAARISTATVSRLERGRIGPTSLVVLRRVFAAMDGRVDLIARWHGGDLDRLLDARHAGLVETVGRRLSILPGWVVRPEVTYSIRGERGSIDLLSWHPGHRALLIIEVKSVIADVGGLLRQVDRYRRLAREIARQNQWSPQVVAVWVVVADGRTARRRLAEHRTTLRAIFPVDGHAIERWLRHPETDIAALSFMPIGHVATVGRRRSLMW
jgi:transcriptional regulator with XRE-family HTH domain